jgi:hypothetical protein
MRSKRATSVRTGMRLSRHALAWTVATLLGGVFLSTQSQAQPGPFTALMGSWIGNGSITLSDGRNEPIRCRATYMVAQAGNQLQQNLRCAGDSFRFDLSSDVGNQRGAISGTWSEPTRGLSGNISGSAIGNQIQVRVGGPGFAANLLLVTRGDRQSVSIRSAGTEIAEVSITLARRAN